MLSLVEPTDKVHNPESWNAILVRDGTPYSVNHYPEGRTFDKENPYKKERVEIRYRIDNEQGFAQLKVDGALLGFSFDEEGRRI